jgi:hypothetical protein
VRKNPKILTGRTDFSGQSTRETFHELESMSQRLFAMLRQ